MMICSTVSASARRKLPSSAFWIASISAILSSVIGFSSVAGEASQLHPSRQPDGHLISAARLRQTRRRSLRRAARRQFPPPPRTLTHLVSGQCLYRFMWLGSYQDIEKLLIPYRTAQFTKV